MMNDPHQMDVITDQLAKRGQSVCGDSYYYHTTDDYFICVLADGLGSGEYANEASSAVVNTVKENHDLDISTLMDLSNQSLLHKRGAAVGVIKINFNTKELAYCCTGNIRFFFYGDTEKLIYPLPTTGYLSGKRQAFKIHRFDYTKGIKFLMFSDGYPISGIKKLMNKYLSIEATAKLIKAQNMNLIDDATFIIGSLQ